MLDHIDSYELEISSDCNAACPVCDRTEFKFPYRGNNNISVEDIKHIFYKKDMIEGVEFLFSGVLGDPILNPECYEICKYLTENGGRVIINTNGGYNTVKFWDMMGRLNNLCVDFATDGGPDTNHLYRVNVKWEVLHRNMKAYSDAGGEGRCVFIEFDHNKKDCEFIKNLARELNFRFRTRVNRDKSFKIIPEKTKLEKTERQNQENIIFQEKINNTKTIKTESNKTEIIKTETIKTHGNSDKNPPAKTNNTNVKLYDVRDLFEDHKNYAEIINQVSSTIVCRHMKEKSLFIGANMTLWPCCHLYADHVRNGLNDHYPTDYNNLRKKSIHEIVTSPAFTEISNRWDAANDYFLPRCVKTCAVGGFRSRSHSENYKVMAKK